MVHHKQLSNNILPYNEGFEGKKTGYRAKSSLYPAYTQITLKQSESDIFHYLF